MQIFPDKKEIQKSAIGCAFVTIIFVAGPLVLSQFFAVEESFALVLNWIAAVVFVIAWLIGFPLRILWLKHLSYEIEDSGVLIRKGILTKTQQNIPYQKITDFKLVRSIFDRYLGIASIQIQTAGQGTVAYEGILVGLIDWDELLDDLRMRIKSPGAVTEVSDRLDLPAGDKEVLGQILDELKAIRAAVEEK